VFWYVCVRVLYLHVLPQRHAHQLVSRGVAHSSGTLFVLGRQAPYAQTHAIYRCKDRGKDRHTCRPDRWTDESRTDRFDRFEGRMSGQTGASLVDAPKNKHIYIIHIL
jgi:hypothetical protein